MIDKDTTSQEAFSNMAGNPHNSPLTFSTSNTCFAAGNNTITWILDSGAAHHMLSSKDTLLNPIPANSASNSVHLPNGHKMKLLTVDLSISLINMISIMFFTFLSSYTTFCPFPN